MTRRWMVVLFLMLSATSAHAQVDTAGVRGTVQRFFDAMATKDTTTLRALMAPGMSMALTQVGPQPVKPRYSPDASFLTAVAVVQEPLIERMWNPTIHIDGPVAVLWTPYDFHNGKKFSHCGTDVFTLMKSDTGWQIVGLAFTIQRT